MWSLNRDRSTVSNNLLPETVMGFLIMIITLLPKKEINTAGVAKKKQRRETAKVSCGLTKSSRLSTVIE
jgi:hypothetical protein